MLFLQGSTGEELALFMRLHLLQGIVAFHQHNIEIARTKLSQVENLKIITETSP